MKIQKNPSRFIKIILFIAAALVVAIGGYSTMAARMNLWPFAKNTDTTTSAADNTREVPSQESSKNHTPITSNESNSSPDKTPKQYEQPKEKQDDSTTKTNSSLTGAINYLSISNGTLLIRVTIDQRLDSGNCNLTLTHNTTGAVVKRTASITANPSSATCRGFDIPTSSLKPGKWKILVDLSGNGQSGKISGSVSI